MSKPTLSIPTTDEIEFETILTDVLHDNGNLKESLGHLGVRSIYDFIALSLSEIDSLTKLQPTDESLPGITTRSSAAAQATPSSPIRIPLLLGERVRLSAFKGYICWYQLENEGSLPTFMLIKRSEFNAFRISPNWNPDILFAKSLPTPRPPASKQVTRSPSEDFKHDPSHYLPFCEDKQWDSWEQSTISTARAHGCEDVFDPNYKPQTIDDCNPFVEKQKSTYSVFESVIKTARPFYPGLSNYIPSPGLCSRIKSAPSSTMASSSFGDGEPPDPDSVPTAVPDPAPDPAPDPVPIDDTLSLIEDDN